MSRHHTIIDARSVGCGRKGTSEGLLRDRAEVRHGEAHDTQSSVEFVERNAGLGNDRTFFSVDLLRVRPERNREGNGR